MESGYIREKGGEAGMKAGMEEMEREQREPIQVSSREPININLSR
jgi:hypothetical protein